MRTPAAAGLVLLSLLASSAAFAADYPFSGFFATTPTDEDQHKAELRCAYGFFIQDKDGSYINYHLDLPRFVGKQRGSLRRIWARHLHHRRVRQGRIVPCDVRRRSVDTGQDVHRRVPAERA